MNQQRATNRYKWLRTSSGILYMAGFEWLLITCDAIWQATMWRMSFSLTSFRLSNRMKPLIDNWVLDRVILGQIWTQRQQTRHWDQLKLVSQFIDSGTVKSRRNVLGCFLEKQFQTLQFLWKQFGNNWNRGLIVFIVMAVIRCWCHPICLLISIVHRNYLKSLCNTRFQLQHLLPLSQESIKFKWGGSKYNSEMVCLQFMSKSVHYCSLWCSI